MERQRIAYLLERYLENRLSPEEKLEFNAIAKQDDTGAMLDSLQDALQRQVSLQGDVRALTDPERKKEMLQDILSVDKAGRLLQEKPRVLRVIRHFRFWAAACVLFAVLTGTWFLKETDQAGEQPSAPVQANAAHAADFIRSLTLPDGSLVVLKSGSTLEYPDRFGEGPREVKLVGEAFFDVAKAPGTGDGQQFIIHTGKLKTTVLGTSFNIKAYPWERDIVVSVASGTVKVADESKVLAVLTQKQQITYNLESAGLREGRVDVGKVTDWAGLDMEFDGVSFETIARLLEKRYGVSIQFKNPALSPCLIVANFAGTETLQNVMETLCTISNASYHMDSFDKVVIDGNGCH